MRWLCNGAPNPRHAAFRTRNEEYNGIVKEVAPPNPKSLMDIINLTMDDFKFFDLDLFGTMTFAKREQLNL